MALHQLRRPVGVLGEGGFDDGVVFGIDIAFAAIGRPGKPTVSLGLKVELLADAKPPFVPASVRQRGMKLLVQGVPLMRFRSC